MRDWLTRVRLRPRRSLAVTLLLILVSVSGLISTGISNGDFLELNRVVSVVSTRSPTATYSGYLSVKFFGTYHYATAEPACRTNFIPCLFGEETVFYLVTGGGEVRLVFYCGFSYCSSPSDIPVADGTPLHVKGTFLVPTSWPTGRFEPAFDFIGDLYVLSYGWT